MAEDYAGDAIRTLKAIPSAKRTPAIKVQIAAVYAQLADAQAQREYAKAIREQTAQITKLWDT